MALERCANHYTSRYVKKSYGGRPPPHKKGDFSEKLTSSHIFFKRQRYSVKSLQQSNIETIKGPRTKKCKDEIHRNYDIEFTSGNDLWHCISHHMQCHWLCHHWLYQDFVAFGQVYEQQGECKPVDSGRRNRSG